MSTVYKYCGSSRIDIIKNLELKITPPNQFNDPFEFSPHVICSDVESKARNLIEPQEEDDFLNKMYQKEKMGGKFNGSFSEFKNKFISRLMPAILVTRTTLQGGYSDMISDRFGVLCLSKKRDSIVMFAHYGDEHRGLVIGFDGSHAVFQKGEGLRPVNYVSERVVHDMSYEISGEQEREYFKKTCLLKK
jgi:hypothetical protein